jgi:hypothetical protein
MIDRIIGESNNISSATAKGVSVIQDHTTKTLCLTLVAFMLRALEFFVQMDAIIVSFMHVAILVSALFASITGFMAMRDRWMKKPTKE